MPRRNRREQYEPLDMTTTEFAPRTPPPPSWHPTAAGRQRAAQDMAKLRRQRLDDIERQTQVRLQRGIDWAYCLVPGCGSFVHPWALPADFRDTNERLPLCKTHAIVAWRQVQLANGIPAVMKATEDVDRAIRERQAAKEAARQRRRLESQDGHIYFLRQNGLVKAGWTRDLRDRLKSYGPDVEVLCHYKGTRQDETDLHRSLRPALAKGREWYEDGAIVAHFVAEAINRHGKPRITADWTEPTKEPIKLRRR